MEEKDEEATVILAKQKDGRKGRRGFCNSGKTIRQTICEKKIVKIIFSFILGEFLSIIINDFD